MLSSWVLALLQVIQYPASTHARTRPHLPPHYSGFIAHFELSIISHFQNFHHLTRYPLLKLGSISVILCCPFGKESLHTRS